MSRSMLLAIIVALLIGFVADFLMRPILAPLESSPTTSAVTVKMKLEEPRSVEYFVAHVDEARRLVAGCRDGSARGEECTNAETAVKTEESKERFRRFREDR
jgi:hypothetical protein